LISRSVSKLFILIALLGSMPVFAANKNPDETVLINQTSVLDAGGFPFKISTPGSYKLIGNLVVPANTSGILIQSNDVTLDLNGFSITGAIVCDNQGNTCLPVPTRETTGVEAIAGAAGNIFSATIKNGHVRGFSLGVSTFGGIVEEITAESNFETGIAAEEAVVRRNHASRNHGAGITGINSVLTENVANSNQGNGFIMAFGGVFGSNSTSNALSADISVEVTSQGNNSGNGHVC